MWCCGSPIVTFNGVPLPLNLGVSISFGPRSVEEGKCPATSVWTTKRGMLSASPTGALTWGAWSWQVKSDDPEVATWIGSPTTQETSGCAQLSSLHLGGIAAQAPCEPSSLSVISSHGSPWGFPCETPDVMEQGQAIPTGLCVTSRPTRHVSTIKPQATKFHYGLNCVPL